MPAEVLTAAFQIKIDGVQLQDSYYDVLHVATVDMSIHMPDMATIELRLTSLDELDGANLASVGKELELLAVANAEVDDGGTPTPLFKGPIVAVDVEFLPTANARLILRAYDKSFGLHMGTKYRSFVNQKDSDMVSKIAAESGVSVTTDATTEVHKHVLQANVSNWDFILERARLNGYVAVGRAGKLQFVKPETLADTAINLDYGSTLQDLTITQTMVGQVNEVAATGWDQSKKQVITGKSTAPEWSTTSATITAPSAFLGKVGWQNTAAKVTVPALPSSAAATTAAKAARDVGSSQQFHAYGRAYGNPAIVAGGRITLTGIGTRFSGEYTVTRVRHVLSMKEPYLTEFWIGGMSPSTLASSLLPPAGARSGTHAAANGLVPAIVTNIEDKDGGYGRVKVKYPWLDDAVESNWARVVSPGAGATRGLMILPEVNDEVIVGFLHGDFNNPYVLGGVWNHSDAPPTAQNVAATGGKTEVRQLKTRAGHMITLKDKSGEEQIEIKDKEGNFLLIDTKNKLIHLNSLGDIKIDAVGAITVNSKSMAVSTKMDFKVDAKTDLKLAGLMLTAEGKTKASLKAPLIDVTGTGPVTIKGTPVGIN